MGRTPSSTSTRTSRSSATRVSSSGCSRLTTACSPRTPWSVSRHQNRVQAPAGSPLRELLQGYAEGLAKSPWALLSGFPYSFDRFHDGQLVPLALRRRYRALPPGDARRLGNPFQARQALLGL